MNDKIAIKDHQDTIEISFEDVEKYHGQAAIAMVAVTFKALQGGFAALLPYRLPQREELIINIGHPGPGVRDTFEMVTRAVTRGSFTVDTARPKARWSPYSELSYSFTIGLKDGREVELVLKEGVLPAAFFELSDRVRRAVASAAEQQELVDLKRAIVKQVLPRATSELFTVELRKTSVAA